MSGNGNNMHGKKAPYAIKGFCPVAPVPKGRPRFNSRTHITYTPKATAEYEDAVRAHFVKQYGKTTPPMDGPLLARYEFIVPRPKSVSKKLLYKDTKPDIDNFVKSFQDALDFKCKDKDGRACGVIANDSRIAILVTSKRYAREGERCGTRYSIQRLTSILVVLGDAVDKSIADILVPNVPAIRLAAARQIAVERAQGAFGSASGVQGAGKAGEPVKQVYVICGQQDDRGEIADIVRTAFPEADVSCVN